MNESGVSIGRIRGDEVDDLLHLLQANHLPLEGLRDHLATTLVARDDGRIVGSAALEVYSDGGLLRSVAVAAEARRSGVGRELTDAAIAWARRLGVPTLYLLTTTAQDYFPRFGFSVIGRGDVPPGIQGSVEFTSACPSSAMVMRKVLIFESQTADSAS